MTTNNLSNALPLDNTKSISLFAGIAEEKQRLLLNCLGANIRNVSKGAVIVESGEQLRFVGIVLSGQLHLVAHDYYGNRTIIAEFNPGELFGQIQVCAELPSSPLDVEAATTASVLLINSDRLAAPCPNACPFHTQVIRNLLRIIATTNVDLAAKLLLLSRRTTRSKLLTYLGREADKAKSPTFTIPFNRQQLADYLAIERSAMSAELSRMRKEGLLDFERNTFTLKVVNQE